MSYLQYEGVSKSSWVLVFMSLEKGRSSHPKLIGRICRPVSRDRIVH